MFLRVKYVSNLLRNNIHKIHKMIFIEISCFLSFENVPDLFFKYIAVHVEIFGSQICFTKFKIIEKFFRDIWFSLSSQIHCKNEYALSNQ